VLYDAFISHASEDKDEFVRSLASALRDENIEVWYDEFSLAVGDSLAQSISRGLAQSRFGIIVVSQSFIDKPWPQWELNGLVARQNSGKQQVILPVWHQVTRDQVLAFCPPIADIISVNSDRGLVEVVRRLSSVIHPKGSTLVTARDHLIDWHQPAPVVTDDWWLDVAAFAESNEAEGGFQEAMGWGRWGFPLPAKSTDPAERGIRLAWAAMQMRWEQDADELGITQMTPPELVLRFIADRPPLQTVCHENLDCLRYLLAYAPQLSMRGMGGEFEEEIEAYYQSTLRPAKFTKGIANSNDKQLICAGDVILRQTVLYSDPEFWASIACDYIQGVLQGPPVTTFEHFDYVPWLLSQQSDWMPEQIRRGLLAGIAHWGVWRWYELYTPHLVREFGFQNKPFTGAFTQAVNRARRLDTFRPGRNAKLDLEDRIASSVRLLDLPESAEQLVSRFNESGFISVFFARKSMK
jgi:hypothetical protein